MTIELSDDEVITAYAAVEFYLAQQSFSQDPVDRHEHNVKGLERKLAPYNGQWVTASEGGDWIRKDEFKGNVVHSIKFEDGRIWDAVNGWRK